MRIKFFLVLGLLTILISGCMRIPEMTETANISETRYYKTFNLYYVESFVERFYDPDFGIVCYAASPDGGISCIYVGEK